MGTETKTTVAFFRVEGTLVGRGVLAASAYFAANRKGFGDRLVGLGQVAIAAPAYAFLGQANRTLANRLAWLACRDMSQDRVSVLAEEYFEDVLKGHILDRGVELLERARAEGHRVVLVSESLAEIVEPLVRHFRHVDHFTCNRLEYRDGAATGRLLDPVVGGHSSGRWATRFAEEHGVDLTRSTAFASHGPDVILLMTVGRPCAVNPDFALRSAAREADWPIVDYAD
ncbi:MAG: haloacid dehalogenase-like hydrolase [Planctomycetes bacterium]|nr:haloacid dehalogenase-like hydrolase [Planctomycetota bacterium]